MKEQLINDDLARRFLLGQLSEPEQSQMEERAFTDPDIFAQLESVEDDLIDEFLQNELSPLEREHFETHFLSRPGRRENLKLSWILQHHFNKQDDAPVVQDDRVSVFSWFTMSRPMLRLSVALAFLVLLVFAIWLYIRFRETQNPSPIEARKDGVATPTPEIRNVPTVAPTPEVARDQKPNSDRSPQKNEPKPGYAVLLPGSIRSSPQPLDLPPGVAVIGVELPLYGKAKYRRYEAALQTDDGNVLQHWPNLRAQQLRTGKGLQIRIPASLLKPEEIYRITVSARSADQTLREIDSYDFQAVYKE